MFLTKIATAQLGLPSCRLLLPRLPICFPQSDQQTECDCLSKLISEVTLTTKHSKFYLVKPCLLQISRVKRFKPSNMQRPADIIVNL
jgi:hypothetical protein